MTTVACNREMMVSDSKVSIEHKGISYPAVKIMKNAKMVVGAAGMGIDCSRFMKWALNDFKGPEPKWLDTTSDDQAFGLILKEDGIYIWCIGDKDEPEKIEAEFFAIGSGGKPARASMIRDVELGQQPDPVKAVEVATKVDDLYSGPPIQILKLKNNGSQ